MEEKAVSRELVTVVAPVYNESSTLPRFVARLAEAANTLAERYTFEFVLVDDGSSDGSLDIARQLLDDEPRLRVIELRRNFGQTAALQAGFAGARGAIVVSMDSDLQHFPEEIGQFLALIEDGYDLVCGWRHERHEGVARRWPSRIANWIIRSVSGVPVHDFGTTYRAYRADLLPHIRLLGEQHRFIPALAALVGARIAEVKIQNIERPEGKSSYGLGRIFGVTMDLVFLHFSFRYLSRPLRAFGKLSLVLVLLAALIASWLLARAWATGTPTVREHSGWVLLAVVMVLSAVQLTLTGVLAEILVRVYYRTSRDDGYVVRREYRSERG